MRNTSSLYFSVQGVLFPEGDNPVYSVSLEVTIEGTDLIEVFNAGQKEVSRHRYADAAARSKAGPPSDLEPSPLTEQVPASLAPYAPIGRTSSFALFRVTIMSHLISSKKDPWAAVPTRIDIVLDSSGIGAYSLCDASNGTLFELAPYSVSRLPIDLMMALPPWLPEFLKGVLIVFALWKIKGALALAVIPWLSVLLLLLAIIALVAFIIMEIAARRRATGGLTPAQDAALQNAVRLKKLAEQREQAIKQAGRDPTPEELEEIQDMLEEITNTANDLGGTLNPDSEDAKELKEMSEDLKKLQGELEEALPD
jgi:hypothetical protein